MKTIILDVETTGVSPTESRIICIGVKDCDSGEIKIFFSQDEQKMVEEFLEYYHQQGFNEIIGFNIGFDIQHIFSKILKYRLVSNGFLNSAVRDLMNTLKSVRCGYTTNKSGKLEDWTTYLFGECKLVKGESVPKLFDKGEIQKIMDYNRKDVELTYRLWQRIKEAMG